MSGIGQFLIERQCPHMPALTWPDLPLCVWVELAEDLASDRSRMGCDGLIRRVIQERGAVNGEGKRYGVAGRGGYPVVCEHMGHLIE